MRADMFDVQEAPSAAVADAIAQRLRSATPWIRDAAFERRASGLHALLTLDPNMAKARAEQQGLPDDSLEAAVNHPNIRSVLGRYIASVNVGLSAADQIVSHEIVMAVSSPTSRLRALGAR